jgi:hypothetical protein
MISSTPETSPSASCASCSVYAALADEGRDVCGGEEDECNGEVLDQRDVEAGFAAELDVTA